MHVPEKESERERERARERERGKIPSRIVGRWSSTSKRLHDGELKRCRRKRAIHHEKEIYTYVYRLTEDEY